MKKALYHASTVCSKAQLMGTAQDISVRRPSMQDEVFGRPSSCFTPYVLPCADAMPTPRKQLPTDFRPLPAARVQAAMHRHGAQMQCSQTCTSCIMTDSVLILRGVLT